MREACFLSEFGPNWSVKLATGRQIVFMIVGAVLFGALISIALAGWLGLGGAKLILWQVASPVSTDVPIPLKEVVFGYFAEAGWGAYFLIGLPCVIGLTLCFARACGPALARLEDCLDPPVEAARQPCEVARKWNRRILSNLPGIALLIFAGCMWVQNKTFNTVVALEDADAGKVAVEDWDYGFYQIPYLEGATMVFNKWPIEKQQEVCLNREWFPANNLPGEKLKVSFTYQGGGAFPPDMWSYAQVTGYCLFMVLTQFYVTLGLTVALALLIKAALWVTLIWFYLPLTRLGPSDLEEVSFMERWVTRAVMLPDKIGAGIVGIVAWFFPKVRGRTQCWASARMQPSGHIKLDQGDKAKLFGLGDIWAPVDWLLGLLLLEGLYYGIQKPLDSLAKSLVVSSTGGSSLTLMIHFVLLCVSAICYIAVLGLVVWRSVMPFKAQALTECRVRAADAKSLDERLKANNEARVIESQGVFPEWGKRKAIFSGILILILASILPTWGDSKTPSPNSIPGVLRGVVEQTVRSLCKLGLPPA